GSFRLSQGQGDEERRALPRGAAGGELPAVALDDLAADGQPHAGALVLAPAVQPLERGEDPLQVLLVKADAVVLDAELAPERGRAVPGQPGLAVGQDAGPDPHPRWLVLPVELEGVADEVLQ